MWYASETQCAEPISRGSGIPTINIILMKPNKISHEENYINYISL